MHSKHPEVFQELEAKKAISSELEASLKTAIETFTKSFEAALSK
jgi:F0F1-type ATP synthase alpha subunit